jgi:hypothetical protein
MMREITAICGLVLLLPACASDDPDDGNGVGDDGAGDDGGGDDGGGDDSGATDDTGCKPVDYYLDEDHDGFGTGDLLSDCDPPDAADVDGDCDDGNAEVHPGAKDVCNGVDDDCDLDFDEDAGGRSEFFVDDDGDGYGSDALPSVEACEQPDGYAAVAGDCDDGDAAIAPGLEEAWTDGRDSNCDGLFEMETPIEVLEATPSWWDAPTAGTTELRILSGYESGAGSREVEVFHDTPEAVVLALTSYEAVNWIVVETYTGTIQKILLSGPMASTIDAPKDTTVEEFLGPDSFGYSYDFDDPLAQDVIEAAETASGLEMTSFHGYYNPWTFTISPAKEWMDVSAYPDCSKKVSGTLVGEPDLKALDPTACASVIKNSHICATSNGTGIDAIGLETGDICTTATLSDSFVDSQRPTLLWADEYVYGCVGDHGMLMRASLLTGEVEKAWVYCSGVASLEGQLYVMTSDRTASDGRLYDSWEDARCDVASTTGLATTRNSRITIGGKMLYSTWHSTNEFEWQDLGGTVSDTVTLEGYDDWIWGIDVTPDNLFTLIAPDGIRWHDLDGRLIGNLELLGTPGYGLSCLVQ